MRTRESFSLKLDRAYEHLNTFEDEASAWVNTEPCGVVDEPDPEGPVHPTGDVQPRRIRVNRVSEVPERLSILIGDCVFNLRSALDHLAFALARAYTPSMSDKQLAGSEFPIFGPEEMTADTEKRKIGCVDPAACAAIKGLQPYNGKDAYLAHPLWQIHQLNRIDKHRTLTICRADPQDRRLCIPHGFSNSRRDAWVYMVPAPRFALKLDAILIRWAPVSWDPDKEVSVKPYLSVEIVFDQGGVLPLQAVIPTLKRLCNFVRDDAVAQLTQFL